MIRYDSTFVQAISYVAWFCIACGFITFVIQVIRWDREYEDFLLFPLRLAIYALPYLFLPGLGILVGAWMLRSKRRPNRKFGRASIFVSAVWLLFWATLWHTSIK